MVGSAEVFLRDLELHHHLRLLHGGEQRAIRLTRLEVNRAILDLDDDIVSKLSI